MPLESSGFAALGVSEKLVEALTRRGITIPSPIQAQAIPHAIDGKDVVGIAQTGTGKTFAFGLPTLMRISRTKGQALILLPTRELALQVDEELKKAAMGFGLRTAVVIGGASMGMQKRELGAKPHVIVATPGRLNDHLEQRTMKLDLVNTLILDEADRMLDMGFWPQIRHILDLIPKERQTMLFSATMPKEIMDLASKHMRTPIRIEVAPQGSTADRVEQEIVIVEKRAKFAELKEILEAELGSVLVFTRMKFGAKRLALQLVKAGFSADEIHGDRSLSQRKMALANFKSGKVRVLVATDIAARGIDVKGIALVVNFDLPDQTEDYVHRIGRTGRAGETGKAVSFVQPDEKNEIRLIERLIRTTLKSRVSTNKPEALVPGAYIEREPARGYRGGQSSGRSSGGYGRNAAPARSSGNAYPARTGSSYPARTSTGNAYPARTGTSAPARTGNSYGSRSAGSTGSTGSTNSSRPPYKGGSRGKKPPARAKDPVENHPERYQPPTSWRRGKTKRPI